MSPSPLLTSCAQSLASEPGVAGRAAGIGEESPSPSPAMIRERLNVQRCAYWGWWGSGGGSTVATARHTEIVAARVAGTREATVGESAVLCARCQLSRGENT
jgi:hypothetical protein